MNTPRWIFVIGIVSAVFWSTGISPNYAIAQVSMEAEEVVIRGDLPRTPAGAVDITKIKETVTAQFAKGGVTEVHFRNFTLTTEESRALFLATDPEKNLLRQVGTVIPSAGIEERQVTFRGQAATAEFRGRVQREEGQLRARLEGIDLTRLSDAERERLQQSLRAQFDRVRLEGARDRGGFRADNRGPGSDNSGPGSGNSGPGSANIGPGRSGDGRGRGGDDDRRVAQAGDVRQDDRRDDRRMDRREDRRDDRQMDRRADRREDRQLDRREDRRVDRQVDRQLDRVARMERPERIQRPERLERPQRPERPERPERSGRN